MTQAELAAFLEAMEPTLRKAFLEAVEDIRSQAKLALIVSHIEAGRLDLALQALNLDPAFFAPLDDAMRAAYLTGGRDAITGLPAIPDPFPVARSSSGLTAAILALRLGFGSSRRG